jgi:DNA adenine methylase
VSADRTRALVASPFRYPGGKSRLVPQLRPWLAQPGMEVLLEPFAGGASMSLAAVAEGLVEHAVLVECDDDVAAVWQTVLSADASALAARVRAFRATDTAVAELLQAPARSTLDRAFLTLVRNRVNRGGMLHPRAGRLRRGERDRGLTSRWYPETLADRILDIAALRERISFRHGDGIEALRAHAGDPRFGAFVDPPYTIGGRRAGERLYVHSDVDHPQLFAAASSWAGPVTLTYADTPEVRELAAQHDFDVASYRLQGAQRRVSHELLVGPNIRPLARARRPGSLRQSDSVSRRALSDPTANIRSAMTTASDALHESATAVHVASAAERLGVSRRTVERLIADGALVRCAGPDRRSYVTSTSVTAAQGRRTDPMRRGSATDELTLVLASMDKLLSALRDDRAALLQALRERDEARAEVSALRTALADATSAESPAVRLLAAGG